MTDNEAERVQGMRGQRLSVLRADGSGGAAVNDPDRAGLALRLHRRGRERADHFRTEAVRSPAWDMLLSLFIARAEGLDAPLASLCAANRLSPAAGRDAAQALIAASLARWKPGTEDSDSRRVELTPHGASRMDQFLQRVALSA